MRDSCVGRFELRAGRQNPGHVEDGGLHDLVERDNRERDRRAERRARDERIQRETGERHEFGEDERDGIEITGEDESDLADEHQLRLSAFVDLAVRKGKRGNELAERLFPAVELHDADAGGHVGDELDALVGGLETAKSLFGVAVDAESHQAEHHQKHDDNDQRGYAHAEIHKCKDHQN